MCAVPSTLVALCLNEKGLERVKDSKALDCFIPIFTTPTYLRALQVPVDLCYWLAPSCALLMTGASALVND